MATDTGHQDRTWLVEIGAEECADLIASSTVGRLAVIVDGRPEIYPVNHVYDRSTGQVAFPAGARTKWRAALGWPWVAFEVDGMAPSGASAWSVLVVGRAEEITDPDEMDRLASARDVRWAAGSSAHWLSILPTKVTGRWISAG